MRTETISDRAFSDAAVDAERNGEEPKRNARAPEESRTAIMRPSSPPIAPSSTKAPRPKWLELVESAREDAQRIVDDKRATRRIELDDAAAARLDGAIAEAAGAIGRADLVFQLRPRAALVGDAVLVEVLVPLHVDRPKADATGEDHWLDTKPELVPLAVALHLLDSKDGTAAELARRAAVKEEERRQQRIAEEEETRRRAEEASRLAAMRARNERWQSLPAMTRAALKTASRAPEGSTERALFLKVAELGLEPVRVIEAPALTDDVERVMTELAARIATPRN